jgi:peptidoglycan/LPS O-acetylase OafA/YrhL
MTTTEARGARRHIAGLDGLRALAAVGVVAYHIHFLAPHATGPVAAVAAGGWVGVDLFFAISGFILFIPFARAHADGRAVSLLTFWRRRALRILPAFWFNLGVLATLVSPALLLTWHGWGTVLADATFVAGYLRLPSVNSVYWSLYCEAAFYVALPFLARAFVGNRWRWGLPATVLVAGGYRLVVATVQGQSGDLFGPIMQLPGVLDQFAYGMTAGALWVALERRGGEVRPWVARSLVLGGGLLALGTLVAIQRGVGLADLWSGQAGPWPVVVLRPLLSAGFAAVILGTCVRDTWWRRLLERPAPRYLGTVSYGLYLWHLPVIKAAAGKLDLDGLSSVGYLAATVAVLLVATGWAAASYHLVEAPFLGRRPGEAQATTLPEVVVDAGADRRRPTSSSPEVVA